MSFLPVQIVYVSEIPISERRPVQLKTVSEVKLARIRSRKRKHASSESKVYQLAVQVRIEEQKLIFMFEKTPFISIAKVKNNNVNWQIKAKTINRCEHANKCNKRLYKVNDGCI